MRRWWLWLVMGLGVVAFFAERLREERFDYSEEALRPYFPLPRVLDGLFARGVSIAKMTARGYGESRPIASNKTEAGRARNRRIEFADAAEAAPQAEGDVQ